MLPNHQGEFMIVGSLQSVDLTNNIVANIVAIILFVRYVLDLSR